jgi:hypothetical protein
MTKRMIWFQLIVLSMIVLAVFLVTRMNFRIGKMLDCKKCNSRRKIQDQISAVTLFHDVGGDS